MKKFVIRWWNSELARFMKHPYLWTLYSVVVLAWVGRDLYQSHQYMKEFDNTTPTE
jgi:hypothetical protein